MAMYRDYRTSYWMFNLWASLFLLLTSGVDAWPQGGEPRANGMAPRSLENRLHVAVHQGRLSVDLWGADVGEVLALIGQQAGIPIISGAGSGQQISIQFTGLELEQGLRRLLRSASLSHAIIYAQGPAGALIMKEVRVFWEGGAGRPLQLHGTERDAAERIEEAGQPFAEGLAQVPAPTPFIVGWEESELARRFREALEEGHQRAAAPLPPVDLPGSTAEQSETQGEDTASQ
jgi:hypothetical protein